MNKLYTVSAIMFMSFAIAGAEQENYVREDVMHQPPTAIKQTTGVKTMPLSRPTEVKLQGNGREINSQVQNGQGQRMMPQNDQIKTGDPRVDAKIKELIAERDLKLKAIHEEYMLKLKAIIGDRQLKIAESNAKEAKKEMSSSTIQERVFKELQMKKAMEIERMRMMASGTVPTDTTQIRAKIFENKREIKTGVESGVGAQFNSLFRGLFGGSN